MKDATRAPRTTTDAAAAAPTLVALPPRIGDIGADLPTSLPRDHPVWQRDVLAVSARVRTLLATLRPVVVRALTFWDHLVRSVAVGGRHVEIDPSGCYRLR
ncbi:MAG: hypothetical protein JO225_07285 [Candidatus Eremiobacteraeota bacterium]|nr:hypothetical protein [Candidatus Eremiobacteraeota bacterium]